MDTSVICLVGVGYLITSQRANRSVRVGEREGFSEIEIEIGMGAEERERERERERE